MTVGGKTKVESSGNYELKSNGNISIEALGNIDIKATGNLNSEATGNHTSKGILTVVEGIAKSDVKAPTVSISGSALAELKGALVKIN